MKLDEHTKLRAALDEFREEMLTRLIEKSEEGKRGWNDPAQHDYLYDRLIDSAESEQFIDVANFAMFLWFQEKYNGNQIDRDS